MMVPMNVKKEGLKSKSFLVVTLTLAVALFLIGVFVCRPVSSCYGPHITATVSAYLKY
jgi:hypothetical protein